VVKAHWLLISLVATGDKLNWQRGSNPSLVKNADDPVSRSILSYTDKRQAT
jgi:hypothetical protein